MIDGKTIGIDCRLWNQTGVGRYIRNLVNRLQEIDRKNEYFLFVRSKDYEQINHQLSAINYQLVKADVPWHSVAEQLFFPKILYSANVDLMHFPYFSVPVAYRKPYVLTMHDLIVSKMSTGKASTLPLPIFQAKKIAYRFVVANALRNAKKIIVPTHAIKKELFSHMKISVHKIEVIYEGALENSEFRVHNSESKLNFNDYFLYVGNAYPHKNLERLIDAFTQFVRIDDSINTKLVLAGKKDYFYERLLALIEKKNLSSLIHYYESPTDEELVKLYKGAHALIIPSLAEGFGLTAVEAMSIGCLVLASDIPALREVCQDAAQYFDPENVDSMKKKLNEVRTQNPNSLKKYIQKGKNRSKIFSWRKMAEQTLAIYESCLSLRPNQ